jgi:thymidylate kinase
MRRAEDFFEGLAEREPGRVVRLDATRPPVELADAVLGAVREVRDLPYTQP